MLIHTSMLVISE